MKSKSIVLPFATLMMLLFTTCNSEAQNNKQTSTPNTEVTIEVIQFHSEHRCMTCNKIEKLSKKALNDYSNISFYLINVDEDENQSISEKFEAFGTALFLYNPATGNKKNLTEFAFMNAGNEEKFIEGLKKEIKAFQKS